jgi:inorganic pyrophosphatase/exopolyphosphatase
MCFKKPNTENIDWVAAREGTDYSDDLKKLVEELLVKGKDWKKDGCEVILKNKAFDVIKGPKAVDEH